MASASPSSGPGCSIPCSAACSPRPGGLALARLAIQAVADPYRQLLSANAKYLSAVLASLHRQRDESLDYRVARKCAHLADSELAMAWQSMLVEPSKRRRFLDLCFTLTWRNHALLSHISRRSGPIATNSSPSRGWRR